MKKEYNEKDISKIDDITHVRLTPSMYVGETSNPCHLIEEALDNSLDEAQAGCADVIAVNINTKENVISVLDNGRGIPIGNDVPILISEHLHTGAKFQDRKSVYEISSGLHGIGLVAVNALSETYKIEIYRDNKYAIFEFKNAKFLRKNIVEYTKDRPFSTKIEFKPDRKIFEKLEPDIDRLRKRLIISSVELPNVTLILNVDKNREVISLDRNIYFQNYCLLQNDKDITEIVTSKVKIDPEIFQVMFCYSFNGSVSPRILSSVNLLHIDSGGTHVNWFVDILKDIFNNKAKKLGIKFQPQDCLCGIRAYINLSLKNPEFHGQTKDKLVNKRSYLEVLSSKLKQNIENYFNVNQELTQKLLEHFENYRKKLDSKKLKLNTVNRRASTKYTKLRDCTSRFGELFIVEGDSAAGSLLQCRDPRTVAVLPLKGKIPNIATKKNILANKEVGELIQSLGTGVTPHFDINKLRYSKVICATDADPDGSHIACLISMIIAVLVPEIVISGKYYIAQTPLFAINEKNFFKPLWSNDEVKIALNDDRKISRFKGLGELSPNQLKYCLVDNNTRKLVQLNYCKNLDDLIKLFSSSDEKRLLLEKEIIDV